MVTLLLVRAGAVFERGVVSHHHPATTVARTSTLALLSLPPVRQRRPPAVAVRRPAVPAGTSVPVSGRAAAAATAVLSGAVARLSAATLPRRGGVRGLVVERGEAVRCEVAVVSSGGRGFVCRRRPIVLPVLA